MAGRKGSYRITIVISGLSAGGAEIMLLKLLERLAPRFSCHVISLTNIGEIGCKIQRLGVDVDAIGMRPTRPNLLMFIRLVRKIKLLRPDIVHTWMYHADLLGGIAARLIGMRNIIWSLRHSNLDPDRNKRSTLWIMRACSILSRWIPRQILSCSERAREVHISAGYLADKIFVIPNGFDLSRFKPDQAARSQVRKELGLSDAAPLIGFIARFDPQKNHMGFIEAAAHMRQLNPSAHFLLAGSGVDSNNGALITAISDAGLSSRIHLLGHRQDVPRLIAALDVLALPSVGEAFPNILGEAMACCIPCVATNVGDSSYIIDDTGYIVEPDDMLGLARALHRLLELPIDERRELGLKARNRIAGKFEIGSVVKHYEDCYDELLSASNSSQGL